MTVQCLFHVVLKFSLSLHRSSLPRGILPQSGPLHVDLSVADIRWQTVAEWLEIAQWSQWRAYRKSSFFRMVPSLTPATSKMESKMYRQGRISRLVLPPDE